MNIKKIGLNTPFISMYLEDGQGIIFNHSQKILYGATPIIVGFVFAIDDGLSKKSSIEEISHSFNLSAEQLEPYYQEALSFFSSLPPASNYLDGQYPEISTLKGTLLPTKSFNTISYEVDAKTSFSITCNYKPIFQQITKLLQPIEKKHDRVHFNLEVIKIENDEPYFNIHCNNLIIEKRLLPEEVVPLIIDRMQILTYQHSEYYFCFHGAALETNDGLLLLPGKSGAGKSTLSAILATKGNDLYSDEMIVLDKNFNVKVLNLPIAIKSGSWGALLEYYPELDKSPEYLREDGRRLKYVWPKSFVQKSYLSKASKQCLIINPNYDKLSLTEHNLKKLSVIETIVMLIEGGYQLGIELNEKRLDMLIIFIERANRYRLAYSSSMQAEAQLKLLWD